MRDIRGITLIALIITIIVLLILAGVTILALAGDNGILGKASKAKEENNEKAATEIINLKITNAQLQSYQEEQKMPDLQYLANRLYEDNEIEYICNTSQKLADIKPKKEEIVVEGKYIYTKLGNYPYEFAIDSSLRLASVNGVEIADSAKDEEIEQLKTAVAELQTKMQAVEEKSNNYVYKSYENLTIPKAISGVQSNLEIDTIDIDKDCKLLITSWVSFNNGTSQQLASQIYIERNGQLCDHVWTGGAEPVGSGQTTTKVFNCKAGDKVKFRCWSYATTDIVVAYAYVVMQEI